MGWLAAAVVLLVVSVVVFAGGLRGPAVAVTVADDAVVRWLAGLRVPGLLPAMRALAALGSWVAISALLYGLLAALLILRRLRQLLIVLAAWIMQGVIIQYVAAPLAQRPRPFGVVFRTGWDAWALPSERMAALVVTLLGILYALVPEGRWRQRGKWAAAAVVLLVAIAHLYLGVLAPTDVLIGVAYYDRRTSHGSTLSFVTHAGVLAAIDRDSSWERFLVALHSDAGDLQDGTTREGIHMGVMAGTLDLVQASYADTFVRDGVLYFDPRLPSRLDGLSFAMQFRETPIQVTLTGDRLTLAVHPEGISRPVRVGASGEVRELCPGERAVFELSRDPATAGPAARD